MNDWEKRLSAAIGDQDAEVDIAALVALASEAARTAAWWQAVSQGCYAIIVELRSVIADLRRRLDLAQEEQ